MTQSPSNSLGAVADQIQHLVNRGLMGNAHSSPSSKLVGVGSRETERDARLTHREYIIKWF